ncbi:tumor protein p63-regulated gene 1 protein [Denticeps clupeoides]|uniref:HSac2 domain-containing protein n=1 Tax=Denticeps clupeoides TaxID=299321 RepID=A0AAY4CT58_9TELE|nr:tumor protein p63-regulated gene 1-like protein [Denticeps clupeoides]
MQDTMSNGGGKEEAPFRPVELEDTSRYPDPAPEQQSPKVENLPPEHPAEAPTPNTEGQRNRWATTMEQFKMQKFFVLRPGTLEHAVEDIKALFNPEVDGAVQSIWLMAEVDHWNNEKERLVFITENSFLICKYDFVMLNCEQVQRVPLNIVDRIVHGSFCFPQHSLLKRSGEGVRVYWDLRREPLFSSRWNPFAVDYPYCTFTYHPVRSTNEHFAVLCEIRNFREQLTDAVLRAQAKQPIPDKANGVTVLNQPIEIEAYVGAMSFIGNQNKLGYCVARGNIGY